MQCYQNYFATLEFILSHDLLVSGIFYIIFFLISYDFDFQYMLNFVIYAARSKHYRAAYSQYLKEKLSFLCGAFRSEKQNRIFIINHRRTASNPELYKDDRNKRKEVDVKLVYSLDLQHEKIIHSYTSTIKVHLLR